VKSVQETPFRLSWRASVATLQALCAGADDTQKCTQEGNTFTLLSSNYDSACSVHIHICISATVQIKMQSRRLQTSMEFQIFILFMITDRYTNKSNEFKLAELAQSLLTLNKHS